MLTCKTSIKPHGLRSMLKPSNAIQWAIESAKTSQALKEFCGRERQSREDRVSIWWVSVEMGILLLILVVLLIRAQFARPKNSHPTESAWYRHALPLFKILSEDRLGSVLPICHAAVTLLPFKKP